MAEVTELLLILQELEGLGWPVKTNEFKRGITVMLGDERDPAPTYEICLHLYNRTSWTIAATLIPNEAAEDLIRGYLERELDKRDLWGDYLAALYEVRRQAGEYAEERRASLLEVALAVLMVVKEAENG